jgi:hypothetical protein
MRGWLALAVLVVMGGAAEAQPMRKQDAKKPVFVVGPKMEPAAARDQWLREREAKDPKVVFRLPFTVWREGRGITAAALGVHETRPAATLELGDSARGVPLVERVQSLCKRGAKRCDRCKRAESSPPTPRLLDLCPEGDYARPTIAVTRGGKEEFRVFDVLRSEFAEAHGVTDVKE